MSIICRSGTMISSFFRKGRLLDESTVSRCISLLSKAQSSRLTVSLSSRQQRLSHVESIRFPLVSIRCFTDTSESRTTDRAEKVEQKRGEEEPGRINFTSHKQGFSEVFSLDVLVSLLRQENAVDLCVIKVPDHIQYAEHFIVVSGVSPRHLRAMALYAIKVYKFLRKDGDPHVKIEGKDAEDWMCVDFGNMVVHFMLAEAREVYELEKLWTLHAYDEQLKKMPAEMLPEDFVLDAELPNS